MRDEEQSARRAAANIVDSIKAAQIALGKSPHDAMAETATILKIAIADLSNRIADGPQREDFIDTLPGHVRMLAWEQK